MKHNTPILAAVRSMHRDDDNHPGRNPYNTVLPLDMVAWEPPMAPTEEHSSGPGAAESVTMWTDENGLDCCTSVLEMNDAR